jgi:hypothetical protein
LDGKGKGIIQKEVRIDRTPMNTSAELTTRLDNAFEEKFHWRPRTQGLFVTGDYAQSWAYGASFGESYIVFPMGPIKFLYNPKIKDLFDLVAEKEKQTYETFTDEEIKGLVGGYKKNDLVDGVKKKVEIAVKCGEYLGIYVKALSNEQLNQLKDGVMKK